MQPTEFFKLIFILCIVYFMINKLILPILKKFIIPSIKYIITFIKRTKFKLLLHFKLSRKEIDSVQDLTTYISRYNDTTNPLFFSNDNNGHAYLCIEKPKLNFLTFLWKSNYNSKSKQILAQATINKIPFEHWGSKYIFIKPIVKRDRNNKIIGYHYYYREY